MTSTPRPRAYSYVRFSSHKQASGDSLRRQHAKAAAYAKRHGLELDESLTYRDLGVSAFDRSNVTRGALGLFLDALTAGKVPAGSYLLVEQLDRLSRASPLQAMDVIRKIVDAGVYVVTLSDERVLTKENVHTLDVMLTSIIVMSRAHEESARKSDLISSFWRNRRELKPPVFTSECPRWLRPKADKLGFELIPDRAESVKKVYQLCADGYGNVYTARLANLEKWPAPGLVETWHPTLITRLLNNRAVLGEHQPYTKVNGSKVPAGEPWANYYPSVVDETLFNLAQAARARRKSLPRRRDAKYQNVFQGVIFCACGSSLSRKYKGSKVQPTFVQYQCTDRIRGVTSCKSISALKLEPPLLRSIYSNAFVAVAQSDFVAWAREEVISAEVELASDQDKLNRLLDVLEDDNSPDDSPVLLSRIRQREQSVRERKAHLDERRAWLASLESSIDAPQFEGDLSEALSKLRGDEHIDFRAKLHERITRVVERISVDAAKLKAVISWRTDAPNTEVGLNAD